MKKYRVEYSGFAYVEADDPVDAEENFDRDTAIFDEYKVEAVQEVDEFTVRCEQ
ncbi:MAG: hypothetical protein IJV68_07250 [Clostridia bacterium]|nr:hypothetical protein [Clostridia bacterium]